MDTEGYMMKLQDKVAIITGGVGGVGKGIALAMAKEGAKVVIVDVNEDAGNETIAELKKTLRRTLNY